jgi:hypothetical protein
MCRFCTLQTIFKWQVVHLICMMNELRRYVTHTQLLLWPRIGIKVRNNVAHAIMLNKSNRDEGRYLRCTTIKVSSNPLLS